MTQGLGSVPPLARAVLRVATYELLRPNQNLVKNMLFYSKV
jgi:transcription termination factor NusB